MNKERENQVRYQGQSHGKPQEKSVQAPANPQGRAQNGEEKRDETQQIPMNGFQQVLDMLRIADPQFRESLLQRLAKRDLELARSLRRDLEQLDF